jgi:hypothetical protein
MGTRSELALGRTGNKGIVTRIAAQYLIAVHPRWPPAVLGELSRRPKRPAVAGCRFDRKSPRNASRIKLFM